jgi:hypothetical protein
MADRLATDNVDPSCSPRTRLEANRGWAANPRATWDPQMDTRDGRSVNRHALEFLIVTDQSIRIHLVWSHNSGYSTHTLKHQARVCDIVHVGRGVREVFAGACTLKRWHYHAKCRHQGCAGRLTAGILRMSESQDLRILPTFSCRLSLHHHTHTHTRAHTYSMHTHKGRLTKRWYCASAWDMKGGMQSRRDEREMQ